MRREDVHGLFSMVLQDTWLFEGTVRENLVYNMEGVTDEQLEARLPRVRARQVRPFAAARASTPCFPRAPRISAGQKQLLTIARAMLQNAPMLILDEATSSVDTRTELLIQRAMDELTKGPHQLRASPTACPRSKTPTRFSSCATATSSKAARTKSLLASRRLLRRALQQPV